MICLVSISLGYLIGSILPAYYFGRLVGVDIRSEGAKYAGTINVYHVVDRKAAIATAIFDLAKGIVVVQVAAAFGSNFHCAQWSGLAAIVGHVLPFYLNFRGGQGVACATGLLLYYLSHYIAIGALPLEALAFLVVIVLIFVYVARHGEVISVIILPVLCYVIFVHSSGDAFNLYLALISLYILAVGIYNIKARKLFVIADPLFRRHWWRVVLRPVATVFVLFYWHYSKNATLLLIGAVGFIFLFVDLVRLRSERINRELMTRVQPLFKKKEQGRFSSMSLFMGSAFLTVLMFDKTIAIASLIFLIFGDLFAKIFGMAYGKHRLFDKTWEGSLAYLAAAIIGVYVLTTTIPASMLLLVIGAITATLVEVLPLPIDDNFSVAVVSASAMTIAQNFFLAI